MRNKVLQPLLKPATVTLQILSDLFILQQLKHRICVEVCKTLDIPDFQKLFSEMA